MINSLNDWRKELREIDTQLLLLLQRRVKLAIFLLGFLSTEELTLGDIDDDSLRLGLLSLSEVEDTFPPLDTMAVGKIFRRIAIETRRLATADALIVNSEVNERLTVRELQVLILIAEDHSLKQIALKLNISVKTVESHKASLMEKLTFIPLWGWPATRYRKGSWRFRFLRRVASCSFPATPHQLLDRQLSAHGILPKRLSVNPPLCNLSTPLRLCGENWSTKQFTAETPCSYTEPQRIPVSDDS